MQAGKRRHFFEVVRRVEGARNDLGEPSEVETTVADFYANLQTGMGIEGQGSGQVEAIGAAIVTGPYVPEATERDFLLLGDRRFEIVSVEDLGGRRRETRFIVREIKATGV